MEAYKPIYKKGFIWKCREHPNFPGDIICLDGDARDRVMCFMCL